jgi:steroid delta-isomerase-like uncharacterized protein
MAHTATDDGQRVLSAREVAERYFAACNAHDAEAMVAMWAEGGVEDYPPVEEGYRAPDELRAHLRAWFAAAPDVHWEVASITADEERAVVHSTMRGCWSGSFQGWNRPGRRFAVQSVDIIEVRDGRIAHNTCLLDALAMMRDIGALPRRHSVAERAAQRVLGGVWRARGRRLSHHA